MVKVIFGSATAEKEVLGKTSLEEKLFPLWEEARIEGKPPTFPQKKGAYILKEVTGPYKAIYIHKNSRKEIEVDMKKAYLDEWKLFGMRASNWEPKKQVSNVDDKYYLHENTSGWWD